MSEWTIDTLKEHFDDLRAADQRALQIKEVGDAKALDLQKETQQYKDEKANELREQIGSERGNYTTRAEMKPVLDFVASQQGSSKGSDKTLNFILMALVALNIIIGFVLRK
jgi:hypothetical protein